MGYVSVIDDLIENKLLDMNIAYIAKVLSVGAEQKIATIQPLALYKLYGQEAKKRSIVSNVPVLSSARYKIIKKTYTCASGINNHSLITEQREHLSLEPLKSGDIVLCICCDRDISSAKNGECYTPVTGRRNSLSDTVIIGIL